MQGDAGNRKSSEVSHLDRGKVVMTRERPLPGAPTVEVCHRRQVNLYGREAACRIRMAWHERHRGYTGSVRGGPTSGLKCGVLMPSVWNGGYSLVGRGFRSPSSCVVFVVLVAGVCVRVCCSFSCVSLLSLYSPFIVVRGAGRKGKKGKKSNLQRRASFSAPADRPDVMNSHGL